MLAPRDGKKSLWEEKLTRSAFFVGALLLHLVIFVLVATYVVFQVPPAPPEPPHSFIPPVAAQLPPLPPTPPKTPTVDLNAQAPSLNVPRVLSNSPFSIQISPIDIASTQDGGPKVPLTKAPPNKPWDDPDRMKKLRDIEITKWHRTQGGIDNHDPSATFPVYIAAYADGDWDCNTQLDANGNIVAGSIPDLMAKISEWSHSQIKGEVAPQPLHIGGPELLDKMPPFIFFTGHKDFVLTQQEVAHLRDYLQNGGMIWGDNALAGRGSRFDVAFRREMKRVIPDLDKNFEPMSLDDDVFTKSRFAISQVPEGMNYYAEPIEHLDIAGKLAILYTPNDYSDLYAMRILPGDTQIEKTWVDPKSTSPLFTNGLFLGNSNVFFRNFTLKSSLAVHRFGMNIVTYLLTRFDDELLLNP